LDRRWVDPRDDLEAMIEFLRLLVKLLRACFTSVVLENLLLRHK
jgi:hypothetical protein